jgi:hypothetical protein
MLVLPGNLSAGLLRPIEDDRIVFQSGRFLRADVRLCTRQPNRFGIFRFWDDRLPRQLHAKVIEQIRRQRALFPP